VVLDPISVYNFPKRTVIFIKCNSACGCNTNSLSLCPSEMMTIKWLRLLTFGPSLISMPFFNPSFCKMAIFLSFFLSQMKFTVCEENVCIFGFDFLKLSYVSFI